MRTTTFQPTLPARGATVLVSAAGNPGGISTHAPRTGSDRPASPSCKATRNFNPRSPHGERRASRDTAKFSNQDFNPRSPHGERHQKHGFEYCVLLISTHAPRTGSDWNPLTVTSPFTISTHAPRTGSDAQVCRAAISTSGFQPTLPARGATLAEFVSGLREEISTHAPRTGSDDAVGRAAP